jgi:hypothetical protein
MCDRGIRIRKCNATTNEKLEIYENYTAAAEWVKNNTEYKGSIRTIRMSIVMAVNGTSGGRYTTAYGYRWMVDYTNLPDEIWKGVYHRYVNGVEDLYVSSLGRVRYKNRTSYGSIDHDGYMGTRIDDHRYKVHRLMALTFLPNFYGKSDVNHKDSNRANNKLFNLEWCTHQENLLHAVGTGTYQKSRAVNQYDLGGEFIRTHTCAGAAGRYLDKKIKDAITKCCKKHPRYITSAGYTWKFTDEDPQ